MNLRTPWKAIAGKSNYRFEVEDAEGFTVCRVVGGYMDGGEAKAKLLAQAPALADALLNASGTLKLVLNQLAQHEEGSVHADRALAAIDAVLRAAGRLP